MFGAILLTNIMLHVYSGFRRKKKFSKKKKNAATFFFKTFFAPKTAPMEPRRIPPLPRDTASKNEE